MAITRYRVFGSVFGEKRYIERMNKDGYELIHAAPFSYTFEKTGRAVNYQYVWLKHGKRSYVSFDYKSRDSAAQAVYANAERALFKKGAQDGELSLFRSADEKAGNSEQKRTSLNISAVTYAAIGAMFASLGRGQLGAYGCALAIFAIAAYKFFIARKIKNI